MGDRFPLLALAGLLLMGAFGMVVLRAAERGGFADRLSTYRSDRLGSRGLYLLADGLPVSRRHTSFELLEPGLHLALLGPKFDADADLRALPLAVDGGSDHALSEDERADLRDRGLSALKSPAVTKEEVDTLLAHLRGGASAIYIPLTHGPNRLLEALQVSLVKGAEGSEGLRTLVPGMPSPLTAGVQRLESRVLGSLDLPEDALPLLVDRDTEDTVAALVPYAEGRVVVIASQELAMNSALSRADNAQFWLSLIEGLGGPLAFDEYHHGFTGSRSIGEFATRYGLQFAAAQLLLGVMVWALALRRFGRPRLPAEERRIGSTDALEATSRLYRAGRHHAHAAAAILAELTSELAAAAGVSPRSSTADVSSALDHRGRGDLGARLRDVARSAGGTSREADVLEVARLAALTRTSLHTKRRTPR